MGLFATRDAFFRFSTDGRFEGYGETSRSGVALAMSRPGGAGEASSFCQKGDERVGDASNGDESRLTIIFWDRQRGLQQSYAQVQLTRVA